MAEPPAPPAVPAPPGPGKSAGAFRTIGELADELGVAPHVLRYWETRFEQLRPLQRAGGRRYYRPDDADLARRIHRWLNAEGYTVRGVQALLARGAAPPAPTPPLPASPASPAVDTAAALAAIRDMLVTALEADGTTGGNDS